MLWVKKHGDRTLCAGSPMFTEKRLHLSHQPSTDSTYLDSTWAWQKQLKGQIRRMNRDESHGTYMKYIERQIYRSIWGRIKHHLLSELVFGSNVFPRKAPEAVSNLPKKISKDLGKKFRCSKRRESRETNPAVTFHYTKWFQRDP